MKKALHVEPHNSHEKLFSEEGLVEFSSFKKWNWGHYLENELELFLLGGKNKFKIKNIHRINANERIKIYYSQYEGDATVIDAYEIFDNQEVIFKYIIDDRFRFVYDE